jgi:hypothetical protein
MWDWNPALPHPRAQALSRNGEGNPTAFADTMPGSPPHHIPILTPLLASQVN